MKRVLDPGSKLENQKTGSAPYKSINQDKVEGSNCTITSL
jgi:hypothetical protein